MLPEGIVSRWPPAPEAGPAPLRFAAAAAEPAATAEGRSSALSAFDSGAPPASAALACSGSLAEKDSDEGRGAGLPAAITAAFTSGSGECRARGL